MPDTQIQEILSKEGAILEKNDEIECGVREFMKIMSKIIIRKSMVG